jgi:hypothetical protein
MLIGNKMTYIEDIQSYNADCVSSFETCLTYSNTVPASRNQDLMTLRLLSRYFVWDVEPTMSNCPGHIPLQLTVPSVVV